MDTDTLKNFKVGDTFEVMITSEIGRYKAEVVKDAGADGHPHVKIIGIWNRHTSSWEPTTWTEFTKRSPLRFEDYIPM